MLKQLLTYGWASSPGRLATAAAVTVGFALLARALRGVSPSGMFAGGAACLLLFVGTGPSAFAVLASLFLVTWLATRFGYRRKQALGVAERSDGRSAWQVSANLAVAALASVAFGLTGNRAWLFAMAAALAEAATDTVASEIGQTRSQTALLITTWKPVPAGTDGGITITGTLAGALAGGAIVAVAGLGGLVANSNMWIPLAAGFSGMLVDSLLGATVQRRGWMSNETVNFWSTLTAAAMAYVLAM